MCSHVHGCLPAGCGLQLVLSGRLPDSAAPGFAAFKSIKYGGAKGRAESYAAGWLRAHARLRLCLVSEGRWWGQRQSEGGRGATAMSGRMWIARRRRVRVRGERAAALAWWRSPCRPRWPRPAAACRREWQTEGTTR
eukprot:6187935-Pleurochrysis_carterae.AAC.2